MTNPNRQSKGQTTGGQFAPSQNPESNVDLEYDRLSGASPFRDGGIARGTKVFDGITYRVARAAMGNSVSYTLIDKRFGGGWDFTHDRETGEARARVRRPPKSKMSAVATVMWRQRGEADIRDIVAELEPSARTVEVQAQVHPVERPAHETPNTDHRQQEA